MGEQYAKVKGLQKLIESAVSEIANIVNIKLTAENRITVTHHSFALLKEFSMANTKNTMYFLDWFKLWYSGLIVRNTELGCRTSHMHRHGMNLHKSSLFIVQEHINFSYNTLLPQHAIPFSENVLIMWIKNGK
jgi:hypothetical protein